MMVQRIWILVIFLGLSYGDPAAKSDPEASSIPVVTSSYTPYYAYYPTAYKNSQKYNSPGTPTCAGNTTKSWCLEDAEYPAEDIRQAARYHHHGVLALYKNLAATTGNSVESLEKLEEETYLCPSDTAYVKPLRALNTARRWRIIVNDIGIHLRNLVQTVRVEECLTSGDACPLVPACYDTQCLQKSIYHRFLVYDPVDYHFPFAIETFKLPASCGCLMGAYSL